MSKTTDANMNERQADVPDLRKQAQALLDALDNAECCETPADFDANMREAIEHARSLLADAKAVLA